MSLGFWLRLQRFSNRLFEVLSATPIWGQDLWNYLFIKITGIDLKKALVQNPKLYPTVGDIFIRPIFLNHPNLGCANDVFFHPVESYLTGPFELDERFSMGIKQSDYRLIDFVPEWVQTRFKGGYGWLYYLSPACYHRIHSPVDGVIKSIYYQPGFFWPVNQWGVENVPWLFQVNERISIVIQTNFGFIGLTAIAALNVGQMSLWHPLFKVSELPSNTWYEFDTGIPVVKGQELAAFHLGSSVMCLWDREFANKVDSDIHKKFFDKLPVSACTPWEVHHASKANS